MNGILPQIPTTASPKAAAAVVRGEVVGSSNVVCFSCYGVATISRLLKIIGLFCRTYPLL